MSKVLRSLTPEEFAVRIHADSNICVIDVRTAEEWETGHLAKAILLPMHTVVRRAGELNSKQETIVVCQRGIRSDFVAQFLLVVKNFENVSMLCGGMNAWDNFTAPSDTIQIKPHSL